MKSSNLILDFNRTTCNKLLNAIFDDKETVNRITRKNNISRFLKYMSTPRTESEVTKYLGMLLEDEFSRGVDSALEKNQIDKVYVNETKGTVVIAWKDGNITKSKCAKEDTFDLNVGFAVAYTKYFFGSSSNGYKYFINNTLKRYVVNNNNNKKAKTVEEKTKEVNVANKKSNTSTTKKVSTKTKSEDAKKVKE